MLGVDDRRARVEALRRRHELPAGDEVPGLPRRGRAERARDPPEREVRRPEVHVVAVDVELNRERIGRGAQLGEERRRVDVAPLEADEYRLVHRPEREVLAALAAALPQVAERHRLERAAHERPAVRPADPHVSVTGCRPRTWVSGLADVARGNPLRPGVPQPIGSGTKPMVAAVVLSLVRKRRFGLDDRLAAVAARYRRDDDALHALCRRYARRVRRVTIRELLN